MLMKKPSAGDPQRAVEGGVLVMRNAAAHGRRQIAQHMRAILFLVYGQNRNAVSLPSVWPIAGLVLLAVRDDQRRHVED